MRTTKSVWGKTLLPAVVVLATAILLGLPFLKSHLFAQPTPPSQPTVCHAVGAAGDSCFPFTSIPPGTCFSGQAFWLAGLDANTFSVACTPANGAAAGTDGFKYIFTAGPGLTAPTFGTFTEFPNGTATLTGHIESSLRPGFGFDVTINFSNFSPVPDSNGTLLELSAGCYGTGAGQVNQANWHFYQNATGTLVGTGNYAGANVTLTPHMHLPQFGPGANGKNHNNGGSSWFSWHVNSQPSNPNFRLTTDSPMDLSADFNIDCTPCSGTIGDFVWQDNNGNGCQDPGEPGMANVQVDLYSGCGNTTFITSTMTDSTGHYQFTGLCAGTYSVCFHTPNGFTHTLANQACNVGGQPSDSTDSDCMCTGTTSPCCVCVTLTTDSSTDLTIDCGYIPNCPLVVTKSCSVPSPSPSATFNCQNMKPISTISMIWNGTQTINIKAWRGTPGTVLLSTQNNIVPGQKVTVTGYTGTPNDVQWEIFDSTTGNKIGTSDFHLSCSDVDMNGPEDCGKAEGDGKGLTGFLNEWIFAGMSGANGISITCGNGGSTGSSSCVLSPGPVPNCKQDGKPSSITFKFTGGGCAASNNTQGGAFVCSGSVNDAQSITVGVDPKLYVVTPSTVAPGGEFTITPLNKFTSLTMTLTNSGGTESVKLDASCSKQLAVGENYGGLTVAALSGNSGGNSISYHYTVTNNGGTALSNVVLTDDQLGQIAGPFSLNAGETKSFDATTTISQTTTNIATASVQGQNCSASSGPVTVTISTPTPTPTPSSTPQTGNCTTSGRPNRLVMSYTGGSCAMSMNSQGPPAFSVCQKFCCNEFSGGLTGVSPVHIIVSDSSTTPTATSQRFFEGDVAAGAQFTVLSAPLSTFMANTYFFIYENGVLKQKVQLHTSCSAPLIRGETFGGVQLDDYSN